MQWRETANVIARRHTGTLAGIVYRVISGALNNQRNRFDFRFETIRRRAAEPAQIPNEACGILRRGPLRRAQQPATR